MDILNIVCKENVKFISPWFCWTNNINKYAIESNSKLFEVFTKEEIEWAKFKGIVHYNGQKPWHEYCVNFDIWWEYYRKCPFYDEQYYFKFFFDKTMSLDSLTLWKRIKILLRYFVYGRYKG